MSASSFFVVVALIIAEVHSIANWRFGTELPHKGLLSISAATIHSDDNAHVEQKNWTHVRQLFDYERFDNQAVVELMNDLYKNEI